MTTSGVISIDLGGTHLRAAVVSPGGEIRERRRIDTPAGDPHPDALVEMVRAVADANPVGEAVVGVPGRVNYTRGVLEYAPHLPQGWLKDLSRANLSERTGLRVHICNDAELAAAGEATFGAGRGSADVVYLTISTGIGAGVVQHGRVVHGTRSMPEPGHTIVDVTGLQQGGRWAMEDFAYGTALGRRARDIGLGESGIDVLRGLEADDPRAIEIWQEALPVICAAVFNLALLFSAEVVVIGGGVGLNARGLLESLRAWLAEHPPPGLPDVRVERAALGDDAGLVGAAAWTRMFPGDLDS
ncbi:MAG TPA: ROK family protein [Candidatus Dormibacteraeota bacterium]|nr:ROK family protein [Candidatus Dormibacteraeota bacterium]